MKVERVSEAVDDIEQERDLDRFFDRRVRDPELAQRVDVGGLELLGLEGDFAQEPERGPDPLVDRRGPPIFEGSLGCIA